MSSNDQLTMVHDALALLEFIAHTMDAVDPLQRQEGVARFRRDMQEWEPLIRTIQERD